MERSSKPILLPQHSLGWKMGGVLSIQVISTWSLLLEDTLGRVLVLDVFT